MPPATSIQTFIEALRTGQTNTTKAFDRIFTRPYQDQSWLGQIQVAGAFDGDSLPQWAVDVLEAEQLTPAEIEHIGQWPNELKEQIRQVVVAAINASPQRNVRFRWGFNQGTAPTLEPPAQTGADPHRVWFATPRSALTQVGPDEVEVGLTGPPDAA